MTAVHMWAPTPRGGGVAIVLAFVGGLVWIAGIPRGLTGVMLAAGTLIAVIGFLDDHVHVRARWRFLVHTLAATWVVLVLDLGSLAGVFPEEFVPPEILSAGFILYLIWMVNLYNFMDGINGIAGIESLTVTGAGAYISVGDCWW